MVAHVRLVHEDTGYTAANEPVGRRVVPPRPLLRVAVLLQVGVLLGLRLGKGVRAAAVVLGQEVQVTIGRVRASLPPPATARWASRSGVGGRPAWWYVLYAARAPGKTTWLSAPVVVIGFQNV
jgi:hypothetical protein